MPTDIIARALALQAGSSQPSTGLLVGVVSNGDSFPTARSDGSPLQNEDYVKPSKTATFPFEVDGILFENRLTKAFYFNNRWEVDPGLVQDTSETPVAMPDVESYSKLSVNQRKINEENVKLIKDIKDALIPYMFIKLDKQLGKSGTSTSVTISVEARKKGTNLKSIAITRNDIVIFEDTSAAIATGGTFTYVDNINANASYKLKVIDIEDRIFTTDPIEFKVVKPAYKGLLSQPGVFTELPLQKDANAEVAFSFDYDGAVYKYPKEFGALTSILAVSDDQAYENYLSAFSQSEEDDYYIYKMNNKCRLINYKFKFINQ